MGYLFILYGILNEWKFFNLNIATVFQFLVLYKVKSYSHSFIQFFAIPWTVAHEAPLSMEFSRQEYWNGYSLASLGDLTDPGIESTSLSFQAHSLSSEQTREDLWRGYLKSLPLELRVFTSFRIIESFLKLKNK